MSWQDTALAAFWADAFANEPLDSHRRIEAAIAAAAASLLPSTDAPMTNHPITPPPELVQQWYNECPEANEASLPYVATQASRWGSDQELEACCEWAAEQDRGFDLELRAARRPQPPSLKDEALKALRSIERGLGRPEDTETLRRALEQLDD